MKKGTHFTTVIAVLMGMVLLAPMLQARTCSGNGDVIGSYGFVGSRSGFFLLGATAPGTTTTGPLIPLPATAPATTGATTVTGSNTPIGALVAGLANRNVFSAAGRVFADGMGNFYAAPAVGGLTMNTLVGTYKVTTDCGIVVTLSDPFTGGAATTTLTLEGEILDSATSNEIDLVGTGPNAAGGVLTLTRTSQFNACSNASIFGNFGVVGGGLFNSTAGPGIPTGTGTVTATTGTGAFVNGATTPLGTPFQLLGRFNADGSGNFTLDVPATTSPLKRNLTGTYTVNVDCTGTAKLVDQAGVTRNISFVLVNETAACSVSAVVQTSVRQALQFVFTDTGVIGSGTARPQ